MPNGYRLFLGALVAITTLNLVLFLQQRRRGGGQNNDGEGGRQAEIRLLDGLAVPKGMSASNGRSAGSIWTLDPTFRLLAALDDPEHLFLLEPALLAKVVGREEMAELMWRFNLSPTILHRPSSSSSVTLGMFADKMSPALGKLASLEEVARIEGPLPFSSNGTPVLQHLFFRWRDENPTAEDQHEPLAVHLVLLHPVRHLLWVGQIPQPTIARLRSSSRFAAVLHYGVHEQIFDRFDRLRTLADSVTAVPDDPGHLLSQLPTSRYMHCPPERNQEWLTRHNVSASQRRMYVTEESIGAIKSLMRRLKMEFWAMCGTLLGWHRQCAPIPYTTDNDFSTWPKYLEGPRGGGRGGGGGNGSFDMTATLKEAAPGHRLRLLYRFGSHATRSAEYSFATRFNRDKVDLFFTYSNATHFMMPFHVAWKHIFQYSIYPQYSLCSVELLGWKLLAPCTAEEVILAEYGPNWDRPQMKYDYSKAPHNSGPPLPFPRNVSQFSEF